MNKLRKSACLVMFYLNMCLAVVNIFAAEFDGVQDDFRFHGELESMHLRKCEVERFTSDINHEIIDLCKQFQFTHDIPLPDRYNYILPEGSVLTSTQSKWIVYEAERHAQSTMRNIEKRVLENDEEYLRDPDDFKHRNGWLTNRHKIYATTDMEVIYVPYLSNYLYNLIYTKIIPLFEERFAAPPNMLGIDEAFIVKYDTSGQRGLVPHTDASDFSFVLTLNDEFEGGNTFFCNCNTSGAGRPLTSLVEEEFAEKCIDGQTRAPVAGSIAIFNAQNEHFGAQVVSGTRYILTGFLGLGGNEYCSNKFSHRNTDDVQGHKDELLKECKGLMKAVQDHQVEGKMSQHESHQEYILNDPDAVSYAQEIEASARNACDRIDSPGVLDTYHYVPPEAVLSPMLCNWLIYEGNRVDDRPAKGAELYTFEEEVDYDKIGELGYWGVGDADSSPQHLTAFINRLSYSVIIPLVSKYFGLPSELLGLDRAFLTKHEPGDLMREAHNDASDCSFIVLLNNDFVGGDTYFKGNNCSTSGYKPCLYGLDSDGYALMSPGKVTIYCGDNSHYTSEVTAGARYALSGFLSINSMGYCASLHSAES